MVNGQRPFDQDEAAIRSSSICACPICLDRKFMCTALWAFPCLNCFGFGRRPSHLPLNPWFRDHAFQRLTEQNEPFQFVPLTDINGDRLSSAPHAMHTFEDVNEEKTFEINCESVQIEPQPSPDAGINKKEIEIPLIRKENVKNGPDLDQNNVKIVEIQNEAKMAEIQNEVKMAEKIEIEQTKSEMETGKIDLKGKNCKDRVSKSRKVVPREVRESAQPRKPSRNEDGAQPQSRAASSRPVRQRTGHDSWHSGAPIPQLLEMRNNGVKKFDYRSPRCSFPAKRKRKYYDSCYF